jgi:Concanavalin A-like lectin/glucanases superfamily
MMGVRGFSRVRVAIACLIVVPGLLSGAGLAGAERDPLLVSHWKLDEGGGTVTVDSVSHSRGSLNNGATFGPGRVKNGVVLDGMDDYVSGPVRVRTDSSFTVAAWVNLREKPPLGDAFRVVNTAVSIDGERTSKFRLGHLVDFDQFQDGIWMFEMPESDTDGAQITKTATSALPTEVNTWVHLTGVYNPQNNRIWLYVNGARKGDGTITTPWQPTGGVRIGRGMENGVPSEFWPGSVDDVRIYQTALDDNAVSVLYCSYPLSNCSSN